MNKKFSTLLAGLALVSSVASAADIKLELGPNEELYQITNATADSVLAIDNGKFVFKVLPVAANEVASTLWCVNVDTYVQGQAPKFDFTNKKEARLLELSEDVLTGLGEAEQSQGLELSDNADINGWAFSSTYADEVEDNKPLFSYFAADSIVALERDGSGNIVATKYHAREISNLTTYTYSLKKPDRMILDKEALNTLLGMNPTSESFKLSFEQTAEPNVFANELTAIKDTVISSVDYVILANKSTGKYLRVDSAYNNTTGVKFVQLTDTTSAATYLADEAVPTNGNKYAFHFEYAPTSDSVYITVAGARLIKEDGKSWADSYESTNRDSLHVYVQDLVSSKVLTVGTDSVSTYIKLGFGTCGEAPASTKTTIPSDLYVIKSTDGKYLAAPIHGDSTVQWVTLEKNVNVWTMPAFQWVVEKQNERSETSKINITNREFGKLVKNFTGVGVQLDTNKDEYAVVVDSKGVSKAVNVESFTAATSAIKSDSLLGYKYLDNEDLLVTRYKFRYLHEFSDDYYAGVNTEENDSILYVGAKSGFSLKQSATDETYGYTSTAVADLKPLYRKVYTLKIRNAKLIFGAKADSVVLDKEGRFAVSEKVTPITFLLKANNEKAIDEKTLFYAFIKTGADTVKVGTDDNNLWMKSQLMTESRTSAFSVEVDDSPLYRRFNTTKENTVASDDPDTLKFFRVNNTADMLFEDAHSVYSKDKEINFLGVNNNIQYPDAKRAIYVDTAYVDRGTGYIKPQYMLAVGVNVVPGIDAEPCPLEHNHGYDKDGNPLDKWTCSHATPGTDGYIRGRYLINTVDSAKVNGAYAGAVRDANYIWNNQVRLAFVEAIHKADTLYILDGANADLTDPVDFTKLPVASKKYLGDNTHKNVVFSFRLLEEGSDNFLIESAETDGQMIAPMQGGWVKIQNGVPVISYAAFSDAANEAEIFNVEKTSETPTANEPGLSTKTVSVVAGNGTVTINGAANKTVVITNVLGQTIANTVLSSDNAEIAVPAGVVVVAVEGEAAVKAIVK
ncbi:hypothetical protein HMPREF1212_03881 [Parabacteroides sp. HGS0025]|uniref:DUF6383 domain-containing protein n=1 Tax=Parabacteroides sp. HGS0025 TaxID=1078087 RepID=UPI000617146C|nr:DUF6383 domain-containing protein [Parabacteroides sp. HGS0025]KKB46387.1 hypothetical protein HMPREF1212_03881 [Parabacteroides sp. HGS0025]